MGLSLTYVSTQQYEKCASNSSLRYNYKNYLQTLNSHPFEQTFTLCFLVVLLVYILQ